MGFSGENISKNSADDCLYSISSVFCSSEYWPRYNKRADSMKARIGQHPCSQCIMSKFCWPRDSQLSLDFKMQWTISMVRIGHPS